MLLKFYKKIKYRQLISESFEKLLLKYVELEKKMLTEDSKWSKKVKERDNGRCVFGLPGCLGKAHHACHIFPRTYHYLRHDVDNGLSGCLKCHDWGDTHKEGFNRLAKAIVDEEAWKRLCQKMEKYYGKKIK